MKDHQQDTINKSLARFWTHQAKFLHDLQNSLLQIRLISSAQNGKKTLNVASPSRKSIIEYDIVKIEKHL